jgi:hypothetical protein
MNETSDWIALIRRLRVPRNFSNTNNLTNTYNKKGTVYPRTDHEGPEGRYRHRYTISLTSALNAGGWSTPRPGGLPPGSDSVPIV